MPPLRDSLFRSLVYRKAARAEVLRRVTNMHLRWQMRSNYRQLDMLRTERTLTHRKLAGFNGRLPIIGRLQSVPGVGPIVARTLVGWIVEPDRFRNRSALSSYAGLGLGQGWTNWHPVGRARASRRGNRQLKRVLFLAAQAAVRSHSTLARRYRARLEAGWDARRAMRDLARKILFIACALWNSGEEYDDARVTVPTQSHV